MAVCESSFVYASSSSFVARKVQRRAKRQQRRRRRARARRLHRSRGCKHHLLLLLLLCPLTQKVAKKKKTSSTLFLETRLVDFYGFCLFCFLLPFGPVRCKTVRFVRFSALIEGGPQRARATTIKKHDAHLFAQSADELAVLLLFEIVHRRREEE